MPASKRWSDLSALLFGAGDRKKMFDIDEIKAEAVHDFVNMMIGALEAGFVESSSPTLAEIHQVAKHHIEANYGIDIPNIVEEWGEDVAKLCGLSGQK